jgi:hypothetical protein
VSFVEADLVELLEMSALQCSDAGHGGKCCHLPDLEAMAGPGTRDDPFEFVALHCSVAQVLFQKIDICDASSFAAAQVLLTLEEGIIRCWEDLPLSLDPFKQEHEFSRGLKRRHDEDYKKKLIVDIVKERQTASENPLANVDGVARSTWKTWWERSVCSMRRACIREMHEQSGTFHLAEDGTRLGRPAKEMQFYLFLHCRPWGNLAAILPPQAIL